MDEDTLHLVACALSGLASFSFILTYIILTVQASNTATNNANNGNSSSSDDNEGVSAAARVVFLVLGIVLGSLSCAIYKRYRNTFASTRRSRRNTLLNPGAQPTYAAGPRAPPAFNTPAPHVQNPAPYVVPYNPPRVSGTPPPPQSNYAPPPPSSLGYGPPPTASRGAVPPVYGGSVPPSFGGAGGYQPPPVTHAPPQHPQTKPPPMPSAPPPAPAVPPAPAPDMPPPLYSTTE
ncbi:uncharacterized protein AMSG_01973 [Thecamonas trahens ATCC 50062]|uniref:Uncharacterized protein n=1 Tax=Thecamonas trahens ATCC 50062 TaxID=461836 RepID=A0A0L0DUE5_THETB|nr:hypothetical protein AMSG_01973 [Thecamonas trahens ATCC 50062]KNC55959.1 hypothetical protein AMSG_01973 [Thecamonas trahens ATCC 50062]|eukprot:XP_013761006.1 hypothetical protein AMSG_01973 [Thecamonas trahens ATCC 50062]